ncbi:fumarylacetoacetate hydrolase family protein [Algoriphagus sediminis]|uniref:Fumarylacetoacetate hydrolase family protein n=1 Tax=Algoriphagus sediminis TaxID=3057113 RepID=A0ABT7YBG2_9BACT|nr:fumarylacetoacetate hydrolase family protein [Algoriphagus sediminis]MDN3203870.1 fumarylacetoacetate hydrolase family protein [Algoriphagus sediminis]
MKLYKLSSSTLIEIESTFYLGPEFDWDDLLSKEDLSAFLASEHKKWEGISTESATQKIESEARAPMGNQEIWAAGVTYYRSRTARMEESEDAGGADFYDKVYNAERPELFFKATASRVAHPGKAVTIRRDSSWDVPEPELTLLVSPKGIIQGYTIGNDMSSRSIEGENPLYLPQAKVYHGSASIGPCILLGNHILDEAKIKLEIHRNDSLTFSGETDLSQLKRKPQELADWLYRGNTFPIGCFLMTGTGIVPDNLTLEVGDQIAISIEGIGTLKNKVEKI